MSIKYLLFVGICLGIAKNVFAVDLTLKPGETSNAVIDATIRKIRTKCILAEDYYFLRRLADTQMESIPAIKGGIWRVNDTQLTTVQSACNSTLKTNCSEVQTEFNVDVSTLTMSDLQKPLYSGLVMSLFILNLQTPIPVSKEQQAGYWIQHINPDGLKQEFVDSANELEQKNGCASAQMDLVFVIDSSGSVGSENFKKTKTFLDKIVSNLSISLQETRVAVVRFASTSDIEFYLKSYSTKTAVRKAIDAINYKSGGTATDLALDMARTSVFTDTRNSSVAAKVLVLVTDGKSNNQANTIAAAEKLKDDGVVIFTIGVVNPNEIELNAAASEPSCTHFINLKDYNEIGFIVKEIEAESCKAPSLVQGSLSFNNVIPQNNVTKTQVLQITNTTQSTLGTTILVSVQCGVVTVYASFNNSYPNEADYDYKIWATDNQPGILNFLKESEFMFVLTVLSKKRFDLNSSACDNPSYDIGIKPTEPRIEAACVVKHVNSSCTAKQLDTACYDTTPVVGEISQLFNNSIHKDDEIQERILEISDSTHSSGSTIWVTAHCAEVMMHATFHNKNHSEDDHVYRTFATDGFPAALFVMTKAKHDHLILTIFAKKQSGLNSSSCENASYSVVIKPKDSKHEVICHRKEEERPCSKSETKSKCIKEPSIEAACIVKPVNSSCTAKQLDTACYDTTPVVGEVSQLFNTSIRQNGQIQKRVLEINNGTDSSGSTIWVTAQCAEVTMHGTFHNKYQTETDYDYRTTAKHGYRGALFVMTKSKYDHLILTIFAKKQHGLKSSSCDNPSYSVVIKPKDPEHEVFCHRKQDERPCSNSETKSKCIKEPTVQIACNVKRVHSPCTAKQLDSACYDQTPVVAEVSKLVDNHIPKDGKTQVRVLEISNSTDSLGSTIWVMAKCAEVIVHATFHNKHHPEADHHYKTSAKDGSPAELFVMKSSNEDHLTLKIISKRLYGFKTKACDHPSYSVSIKPKDPEHEVACHRKQDERLCSQSETKSKCIKAPKTEVACFVKPVHSRCSAKQHDPACYDETPVVAEVSKLVDNHIPKNGKTQVRVLEISNSTHSSGSILSVTAHCAKVIVYCDFHNKHHPEAEHDYKISAKDKYPGTLSVVSRSNEDHLTLTIISKRRYGLNSTACDHPSYSVSIKPKDQIFEVVCHRKEDERPCTPEESKFKCKSATKEPSAGCRLLSINTWISAGLLLAWRLA